MFNPSSFKTFRFLGFDYDEAATTARLRYAFDASEYFTEEFHFRNAPVSISPERKRALNDCLHLLHLVAGVSYYKAAVPPSISIETRAITRETASFLERLYVDGLGEFSYRNDLDLCGRVTFPADSRETDACPQLALRRRSAVPIGGGKDSIVTMETLRQKGEPLVLFSIGDFPVLKRLSRRADLEHIVVNRRIDPRLFHINRHGALNGHIPISAIIAFVLPVAAILYDFDTAVLSNERSADAPNVIWHGRAINHQYSKSSSFETAARTEFSRVLPGFRYFSLLRPYSELYIASIFANYRQYHDLFRSCNNSFRVNSQQPARRWCLNCPKCRFVFLSLAPFLTRHELIRIFGRDLLAIPEQAEGFAALLGLGQHKPFECVGEIAESVVAIACLADRVDWHDHILVRRFAHDLGLQRSAWRQMLPPLLTEGRRDNIPEEFRRYLPPVTNTWATIEQLAATPYADVEGFDRPARRNLGVG